jgi:molybdenum cofactor cytidylyltransferase
MKTALSAIIPAAGRSLRMGRPKQLLPVKGRPMVQFAVERLKHAGIREIILVLGCCREQVTRCVQGLEIKIAVNSLPDSHMLDSVRFGIEHIPRQASGAFIMPVDSCFASVDTLRALIELHGEYPDRFIRPHSGGRGGHPLTVPEKYFEDIGSRELKSLRHLLMQEKDHLVNMHCADTGAFLDLDTTADYENAAGTGIIR